MEAIDDKAIQFAKKHGYKTVTISEIWNSFNGQTIFTPVFDSDKILYTGRPQFIIVEKGIARFLSSDEIYKVMGIIEIKDRNHRDSLLRF